MFELAILSPQEDVESISEALEALDALSVSVEDADAFTPAEHALFGEPGLPPPENAWLRSKIKALFVDEATAQHAQQVVSVQDFFANSELLDCIELPEQDWVRLTQSQFSPVEITPEFWIVPSWHAAPVTAKKIIRLDPGLAFGTGTHPTTMMCLRWLAAHQAQLAQQSILDYGCGSGILAIAAALHGAGQVDAVDIDPAAVQATQENAMANQVENFAKLQVGLPERLLESKALSYQFVVANILATPLRVLAPLLSQHVAKTGHLLLAGILSRQEQELKAAYDPFLKLEVVDQLDGWILMHAQRP